MWRLKESEILEEGLRYEEWEQGLFKWIWSENRPVKFFHSCKCREQWIERNALWWKDIKRILQSKHKTRGSFTVSFNSQEE